MIIDVLAKCKMCGKNIATKTEDLEPALVAELAEKWKGLLTCNRCFDFRVNYEAAKELVIRPTEQLMGCKPESIEALKERIFVRAQKFCQVLENQYFISGLFHNDFPELIIDSPKNVKVILFHLHQTARKMARDNKQPS